jgi:hypothetical protein
MLAGVVSPKFPAPISHCFIGCTAFILMLSGLAADTIGDWRFSGLQAPARLREGFWNGVTTRIGETSADFAGSGEVLIDTFLSSAFGLNGFSANFSGGGGITGDLSGSFVLGNQGRVTLNIPGETILGYRNASEDIIIAPTREEDDISFNVGTRKPGALASSDFEGTWKVLLMRVPQDLTEKFINSVTTNNREAESDGTAGDNETLIDVFFAENPGFEQLTINVDSLGNVTGSVSGTLTANGDQTATLNITGEGSLTVHVNAGINLLTSSESDENVSHSLIVAVKIPTSCTLADAEGIWRWQVMELPARLHEQYDIHNPDDGTVTSRTSVDSDDYAKTGEVLRDIYFSGDLDAESGLMSIDRLGHVTGSDPGTLSLSGTTFTFTPTDSTGAQDNVTLFPNANKEAIIGYKTNVDELMMVVLVKVSSTAVKSLEELVDMQFTVQPNGNVDLTWNEASSFCLSKSEDLGNWNALSGSQGASSHTDTSNNSKGFYRIEVLDD